MNKFSLRSQVVVALLTSGVILNLCCLTWILLTLRFIPGWQFYPQEESIGFSFKEKTPQFSGGDTSAASHLFIHQYVIPEDGEITAIAYLNDLESHGFELNEEVYLLILRPEAEGMRVIYQVAVLTDELSTAKSGVIIYNLPEPLVVKKGDEFGHWQQVNIPTGPIPLNIEMGAVDGFSIGKGGFLIDEISVGNLVRLDDFGGQRDYFINLILRTKK